MIFSSPFWHLSLWLPDSSRMYCAQVHLTDVWRTKTFGQKTVEKCGDSSVWTTFLAKDLDVPFVRKLGSKVIGSVGYAPFTSRWNNPLILTSWDILGLPLHGNGLKKLTQSIWSLEFRNFTLTFLLLYMLFCSNRHVFGDILVFLWG